jgi:hypothetical protein
MHLLARLRRVPLVVRPKREVNDHLLAVKVVRAMTVVILVVPAAQVVVMLACDRNSTRRLSPFVA